MSQENSKYENSVLSPDVAPFFPKNFHQSVTEVTAASRQVNHNVPENSATETPDQFYSAISYSFPQESYTSGVYRDLPPWRTVPIQQYGMPVLQPAHFYQAPSRIQFSNTKRPYNTSRWYYPAFRQPPPIMLTKSGKAPDVIQMSAATSCNEDIYTEVPNVQERVMSKISSTGNVKIQNPSSFRRNSIDTKQQRFFANGTNVLERYKGEHVRLPKGYQRRTSSFKFQKDNSHEAIEPSISDSKVEVIPSNAKEVKKENAVQANKSTFSAVSSEFPSLETQTCASTFSLPHPEAASESRPTMVTRLSYSQALRSEQKELPSESGSKDKPPIPSGSPVSKIKYDKRKKKHKFSKAVQQDSNTKDAAAARNATGKFSGCEESQAMAGRSIDAHQGWKHVRFNDPNLNEAKKLVKQHPNIHYSKENIPPIPKDSSKKSAENASSKSKVINQCPSPSTKDSKSENNRGTDKNQWRKVPIAKHKGNKMPPSKSNVEECDSSSKSNEGSSNVENQPQENVTNTDVAGANIKVKKKKNRKSSRKRKALLQTGKVTVISPELHQLLNQVSNVSDKVMTVALPVNIDSTEEYPELGVASSSSKAKPCVLSSSNEEDKKIVTLKNTEAPQKISVWDFFRSSLYSDVLKKKQQMPKNVPIEEVKKNILETEKGKSPKVSAKGTKKTVQASSNASNSKSRTKYHPHAPIDLDITDLLQALQAIKSTTKKKKDAALATPEGKPVKKKSLADCTPRNVLDSSAPLKKRGKEREKPRKKRPSLMKKIILRERLERKNRHRNKVIAPEAPPTEGTGPDSKKMPDNVNSEQLDGLSQPVSKDSSPTDVSELKEVKNEQIGQIDINLVSRAKEIIHTRNFREYCTQLLSEDIDETVKTLLEDLVRFQDRMFQKDPIKARMKRRLVFGLREVTKHLKLHKIKCIIVAPDLERIKTAGGLDDALQNILKLASEYNVPVIFALKRTQLGKLCKKSVPVSCIGIFNYEGTEENYKSLIGLTCAARKAYREVLEYVQNHLASCADCRNADSTSTTTLSHLPSCDTFLAQVNAAQHYEGEKPPHFCLDSSKENDDYDDDDEWEEIDDES